MKIRKSLCAISAAAALLLGLMQPAAALGTPIYDSQATIGSGSELNDYVYDYDGRINEHFIEYRPNPAVQPVVVYGSKVCNYGNFESMAALLQNKGWNVIGGINGDYYILATYQPLGIVMTDGVLHSSDGGFWGVGFREDGTALIGRPNTKASVTLGDRTYRIYGINKEITREDFYLYTEEYSYTTKNTVPTVNVALSYPEDYELRLNSEVELTVEEIFESKAEAYMREDRFILSLTQDSSAWRMDGMKALQVGDKVKLSVTADEAWNDVAYAVGSLYKLITNGEAESELDNDSKAPRTAVGIRPDGSVVLYTVDGRQEGYSRGMTMAEVAQRLLELGCAEACLLDGGGSTNLHAQYIGKETLSQINRPSGGKQRSVTNYIMLAAKGDTNGNLAQVSLYPNEPIVLKGSTVAFEVKGADNTARPVAVNTPIGWTLSGMGSIDWDGVYTASQTGTDTLRATTMGLSDVSEILVIDTPDSIDLYPFESSWALEELSVYTGERVEMNAVSAWQGLPVLSDNEAYTWTLNGEVGTLTPDGVFTAGEETGSGEITVSAGACSRTIPVTVNAKYSLLEDFESFEPTAMGLSTERNKDYVCFGEQSLRVDYEQTEPGRSVIPWMGAPEDKARYVSMWIYGDGSGAVLRMGFTDGSQTPLTVLDYQGWRQSVIPVPENAAMEVLIVEAETPGTFYVDEIVASTTRITDNLAPEITISESEGVVTAQIWDTGDAEIEQENILLYFDGKPLEFSYDPWTGTLTATVIPETEEAEQTEESASEELSEVLSGEEAIVTESVTEEEYVPEPGPYHRVNISAWDQSGNRSSATLSIAPELPQMPFEDMTGHWAEEYVTYMNGLGVVNGVAEGQFAPDANVTRAQCAVMICRWLGIDTSLYSEVELNFVDTELIPAYALDAVKATYSLGILTGMDSVDGVYFAPNYPLTREQAMTVIGRIEPAGYAPADISGYSDGSRVQPWAAKYVRELVGRGIISGYEDNTLRPSAAVTRSQLVKILSEVR